MRLGVKDVLFILAGVSVFGGAVTYIFADQAREWERFKVQHHCQAIPGDPSGKSWTCDDGKNYFRGGSGLMARTG